ncbi:MAG TPA: DUF4430 domain-containing protein [Candidatus Paceibacterota bacterium]
MRDLHGKKYYMPYKNLFITALILMVVISLIGIFFYRQLGPYGKAGENPEKEHTVTIYIEDTLTETIVPLTDTITALDLLTLLSEKYVFALETEPYKNLGVIVTKIGHHANGDRGEFWQYYVNGKKPLENSDAFPLHDGDLLEWRFAPSSI